MDLRNISQEVPKNSIRSMNWKITPSKLLPYYQGANKSNTSGPNGSTYHFYLKGVVMPPFCRDFSPCKPITTCKTETGIGLLLMLICYDTWFTSFPSSPRKLISMSDLARSCSSITPITFVQSFWHFVQSMVVVTLRWRHIGPLRGEFTSAWWILRIKSQ